MRNSDRVVSIRILTEADGLTYNENGNHMSTCQAQGPGAVKVGVILYVLWI